MRKTIGLKLLTRLRLCLSHLNEHRFNHNFENCVNALCTGSLEAETTSHFFLHYHYDHPIRLTLFNELCDIDMNLPNLSEEKLLNTILHGTSYFSDSENQSVLKLNYKVYNRFKLLQWVYFSKWLKI